MLNERPRLAASEIEEELFAELQKLPALHDTQSVTIRPYSGPKTGSLRRRLRRTRRPSG
jgi:hypothetical protein